MANNIGTLVTSIIKTFSNLDTYPVADSNDLLGGYKTVTTLTEKNNIPIERRSIGMLCYVSSTGITYKLVNGIDNSNWVEQVIGENLSWLNFIWKLFTGFTIIELRLLTDNQLALVSSFSCKEQGRIKDWYYDISDTTSIDNGGTILVTTSGKRLKAANYDYLKPENFGAKVYQTFYTKTVTGTVNGISTNICDGYFEDSAYTIPVQDSTTQIQACLDFANDTIKKVYLSKGSYFFTQIALPDGIYFRGTGTGDFGRRNEGAGHTPPEEGNQDATVLMQLTDVNDDAIVFRTFGSLGQERVTGINFGNFILRGNNSNTIGRGISLRNIGTDRDDIDNYAGLNGTHDISHIQIREFPQSGFFNWKGGVPAYLSHINCYFNGGYGIEWLGQASGNGVVVFNCCDGDANRGGAVIKIGSTISNNASYTFISPRGEMKSNSYYGSTTGFNYAQPYLIEVGDCSSEGVVNVIGGFGNSYTPTSPVEVTEALIFVNTSSQARTPVINFYGMNSLKNDSATSGNRYTLKDNRTGFSLKKEIRTGNYNLDPNKSDGYTGPVARWNVSANGEKEKNTIGSSQLNAIGTLPSIGVEETDISTDNYGTILTQSGGDAQIRNVNQDGSTNVLIDINKNADGTLNSTKKTYDTNGFELLVANNSIGKVFQVLDALLDEKTWRFLATKLKFSLTTLKDDGTTGYGFIDFFRSANIPKSIYPRVPIVLGNPYDSGSDSGSATLTANSASPDVSKANYYNTANTSNTTILYLQNAKVGQLIIIKCNDDFTTIKHNDSGSGNGKFWLNSKQDIKLINGNVYMFVRGTVYTTEISNTYNGEYSTAVLISGTSGNITISGLTTSAIVQLSVKTHSGTVANFDYTATTNNLVINARNTAGAVETGNNSTIIYRILKY